VKRNTSNISTFWTSHHTTKQVLRVSIAKEESKRILLEFQAPLLCWTAAILNAVATSSSGGCGGFTLDCECYYRFHSSPTCYPNSEGIEGERWERGTTKINLNKLISLVINNLIFLCSTGQTS
jgi:hypothetical protein